MHLRDYWAVIRNRRWLIVSITLLVTAAVGLWMASKPDYYRARARLEIAPEGSTTVPNDLQPSNFNHDPSYFNTQLQRMSSPALLSRVVRTLDLEHSANFVDRLPGQGPGWFARWTRTTQEEPPIRKSEQSGTTQEEVPLTRVLSPSISTEEFLEAARLSPYVTNIQEHLSVFPVRNQSSPSRQTRLVDVVYTHSVPELAPKIVNAIADALVLANQEEQTATASAANRYLTKRVEELQRQIRQAEERLIRYAQNHQILSLDPRQDTTVERLVNLSRELLQAENDRRLAEAGYRGAMKDGVAQALAEDSASGSIQAAETRLGDLRQRRALLLVSTTEKWPEVVEIDEQIAAVEKHLKETRLRAQSVLVAKLKAKYEQARARERALGSSFRQQRQATQVQNEAAVNYRLIQQEIETSKTLLNELLKQLGQNDAVQAGIINNMRVVDYALLPKKHQPDGPSRAPFVALAFLVSLIGSVGLVLFLEYLDDTLRSSADVKSVLHLPALAVIPAFEDLKRKGLLTGNVGGSGNRTLFASRNHPQILSSADFAGPMAEGYRRLRTAFLLSTRDRFSSKILVTSSIPGEGKTTTVLNLAISLAETGDRVLVIDADLRCPSVHTLLDLDGQQGLSTLLEDGAPESEVFELIQRHGPTGLHVLPSGTPPRNPAELLGSPRMKTLLGMLARSSWRRPDPPFKHVLIDSPSIAACADSVILSSLVTGVLLVVHGGKSSREIVRDSQEALQEAGAPLLGVVLNNVHLRSGQPQYYEYSAPQRNS